MVSRPLRILAIWAAAPLGAIAVSVALHPGLRHWLIATINDPKRLPALDADPRVRFEPAARDCAQEVAALLPKAIETIETEHGRAFAKPPTVAVYDSFDVYARANGLGDPRIAGVSRAGRALISPGLCGRKNGRLAGVLTHELSHVHFFGWRSRLSPRPPQWFTEGLAVMASHGGAAEGVSDADAIEAIRKGFRIVINDAPWMDFSAIPFEREPQNDSSLDDRAYRQRMAFRQASVFLQWLRSTNAQGFARLLRSLEANDDFEKAFGASLGTDPQEQWRRFVAQFP